MHEQAVRPVVGAAQYAPSPASADFNRAIRLEVVIR